MASNLLLPDPRFRSQTTIPWSDRPWLKSIEVGLEPNATELRHDFEPRHHAMIKEIGLFCEACSESKLTLETGRRVDDATKLKLDPNEFVTEVFFETECIYLVRLFPKLYVLQHGISIGANDFVRIRLTRAASSAMVVLSGLRQ